MIIVAIPIMSIIFWGTGVALDMSFGGNTVCAYATLLDYIKCGIFGLLLLILVIPIAIVLLALFGVALKSLYDKVVEFNQNRLENVEETLYYSNN